MNRRSFFKVIGAVGAAAAVPTMLLEASEAIPAEAAQIGLIREMSQYDLYSDCVIVRYDVLAAGLGEQLSVDMRWFLEDAKSAEFRATQRGIAKDVLEKAMRERGIRWSDLTPLPVPHGYEKQAWTA